GGAQGGAGGGGVFGGWLQANVSLLDQSYSEYPSKIDAEPALDLLVQIARERLGAALGREEVDPLVDLLGDFWRKPDARLVDQAQPRPHQIGFRKLQHLLLAARKVPGLGVALVLQGRKF